MTLPTITAIGNLTSDGELRFTAAGKAIYTNSVAVNRSRKNETGGWDTTATVYLTIKLWEADAETAAEYLRKGDRVVVTGELLVDEWEGKDGSKRQTLVVDRATIAKCLPRQPKPQGFGTQGPAQAPQQATWDNLPASAPF